MRSARSLVVVTMLAAVVATACSDAMGPETVTDASGEWAGAFEHPSYDGGFLKLSLVDIGGTISGTYTLRLSRGTASSGRVFVETSGGKVTGTAGGGRLTLSLSRTDGDWLLVGQFEGRNMASGDWSLGQVRGQFTIER